MIGSEILTYRPIGEVARDSVDRGGVGSRVVKEITAKDGRGPGL